MVGALSNFVATLVDIGGFVEKVSKKAQPDFQGPAPF
jgi:hypothetical protein